VRAFDFGPHARAARHKALRSSLIAAFVLMNALAVLSARCAMAFPWSIDMFRTESVKPLEEAPRVMPPDALPIKNGELPMSRAEASKALHNPLKPTEENIAHGKELFSTYCAVCHGMGAKGDGPVAYWLTIPPANLTSVTTSQTDGYLYGTIRDGGIVMPSYADAMTPKERWQVVLFVRYLAGSKPAGQASEK
jgi:mono/diheme cytochrome c family protein